jgi:beta-galactosidase
LVLACVAPAVGGARTTSPLDAGWRFARGDVSRAGEAAFDDSAWQRVDLPHTYNGVDGEAGGAYYRGPAWYRRTLTLPALATGHRLVLQFDGAALVAQVWVNGRMAGEHAGGYAAFRVDVTEYLKPGDNLLAVRVDNATQPDVAPLGGDFTVFGGLYRGVQLIEVDALHFDLLDDGGPGVYVSTPEVSPARASVRVRARVSSPVDGATLRLRVLDPQGRTLQSVDRPLAAANDPLAVVEQAWSIERPRLWQGVKDPALHRLSAELLRGGEVVDRLELPFGIRHVAIDPGRGFLLNGERYALHGVNLFHSGRPGHGLAVGPEAIDEDARILADLGVTGLRLVHFQHPQRIYELADRLGWVLWTEIPLNSALHDTPAFEANLARQLRELIKQNFNHPAVAIWGLGNEVYQADATSAALLAKMHAVARQEDPQRPTSYAHCCAADDDPLTRQTDVVGYNRYFGWYDHNVDELGPWADRVHALTPRRAIALSEYGAGASVLQQEDPPARPVPASPWHPEQYQALFHEAYWRQIRERGYLWGAFVWVGFDLASAGRHEGDRPGINDKGLATYDRATRKDAFHWYQANWRAEPMVHITSRRFTPRPAGPADIKVYTNAARVMLAVNGVAWPAQTPVDHVATWRGVPLAPGRTRLEASTPDGARDAVVWVALPEPPAAR